MVADTVNAKLVSPKENRKNRAKQKREAKIQAHTFHETQRL
jgi:hypothetical protein